MAVEEILISGQAWLAIVCSMVAAILLGFLWYAPFSPTGKIWMKGMNQSADFKPDPKKMAVAYGLMIVGTFLTMYVLVHVMLAFVDAPMADKDLMFSDAAVGSIFVWLGFFVPQAFAQVSWEGKSWSFMFVNVGYSLVNLQIVGAIMAALV